MTPSIKFILILSILFLSADQIFGSTTVILDTVRIDESNVHYFKLNTKIEPGMPGYATLKRSAPDKYYYVTVGGSLNPSYGGQLLNGKRHGAWRQFIGKGHVLSSQHYLNGKLHGESIFYDPNTNEAIKLITYLHGDKHGAANTFYPSGKPMKEFIYSYGNINGLFVSYYESGKVKEEGMYYQGKGLHKIYAFYYENGQIKETCKYFQGQKNGIFQEYTEEGKLTKETKYLYGELTGKTSFYNDNGVAFYTVTYNKGKEIRSTGTPPPGLNTKKKK
jgi:antitoxin component YwqK of YwqJK toxin-antitoxin module